MAAVDADFYMHCQTKDMRITYAHNLYGGTTMSYSYNIQAPKKPTNVSINSDLLEKARSLKINLSATLEKALAEQLRNEQRAEWVRENADAIQAYNQFVETNGTFSDSVRKF
jgi:antitoxin CcdA